MRNLIGQAQLREVHSKRLRELIDHNNSIATLRKQLQYVFLLDGSHASPGYKEEALRLNGNKRLTAAQQHNITINLQLIETHELKMENKREADQDDDYSDIFDTRA